MTDQMVPLRCQICGDQIGFKSPAMDMTKVVARCYSCAAVEEAEKIARESIPDAPEET